MADEPTPNRVEPNVGARSLVPGDVPDALRRRYLTDPKGGPGLGFYADATTTQPVFRDEGRRLSAQRNDPDVVRDLVAIARHRGWTRIHVQGDPAFRREAWLHGRTAGLDVEGYQPTSRDLEALERRRPVQDRDVPQHRALDQPGPASRLRLVESVIRTRVPDIVEQDRLMERARARISGWLERGARFDEIGAPARTPDRERTGR